MLTKRPMEAGMPQNCSLTQDITVVIEPVSRAEHRPEGSSTVGPSGRTTANPVTELWIREDGIGATMRRDDRYAPVTFTQTWTLRYAFPAVGSSGGSSR